MLCVYLFFFFFFKQKTAYEMRISDWSSDVCSSDLLPKLPCPARAVVQGDGLSLSIAAASIVAKVTRDRAMAAYAEQFPGYGWERNQGYATPEHRAGIALLGVTPLHRRSFRPVREALAKAS